MKQNPKFTAWFEEITKDDINLAGGKGANLGEMVHAGIPVPGGFIVTSEAYSRFIEQAELVDKIRIHLDGLDVNDSKELQKISNLIKKEITTAPMPSEIANQIHAAYRKLGGGLVAVRSSATAEDLPDASFAGQPV